MAFPWIPLPPLPKPEEIIEGARKFIDDAIKKVDEITKPVRDAVGQFIDNTIKQISDVIDHMRNVTIPFLNNTMERIDEETEKVINDFRDSVVEYYEPRAKAMEELVNSAEEETEETVNDTMDELRKRSEEIVNQVVETVNKIVHDVSVTVQGIPEQIKIHVGGIFNQIANALSPLNSLFGIFVSSFDLAFNPTPEKLKEQMKNVIDVMKTLQLEQMRDVLKSVVGKEGET